MADSVAHRLFYSSTGPTGNILFLTLSYQACSQPEKRKEILNKEATQTKGRWFYLNNCLILSRIRLFPSFQMSTRPYTWSAKLHSISLNPSLILSTFNPYFPGPPLLLDVCQGQPTESPPDVPVLAKLWGPQPGEDCRLASPAFPLIQSSVISWLLMTHLQVDRSILYL